MKISLTQWSKATENMGNIKHPIYDTMHLIIVVTTAILTIHSVSTSTITYLPDISYPSPTHRPTHLSTDILTYQTTSPLACPLSCPVNLFICLSAHLSVHLSIFLSVHLSVYLSFYFSTCLSICLSFYLSVYLSFNLSVCNVRLNTYGTHWIQKWTN